MLTAVDGDVDKHQAMVTHMLQRFAQFALQFIWMINLDTDMPISLSKAHKIGQRLHVRLGVTPGVDHVLPLFDHAEITVVKVEHQHRQFILQRRRQLLDIHLNAAIPGHAHYRFIRQRHFHP